MYDRPTIRPWSPPWSNAYWATRGVQAPLAAPAGVEVTRREGAGRSYTFVLNHTAQPARITLPQPMRDLLTGQTYEQTFLLPPLEVAILTP